MIALYVHPKNSNHLRSHLRAMMALDHSRLGLENEFLENKSGRIFCVRQVYVSVKSKLQHPPWPGIPRAFDTFAVPWRREFHYQSLPGGGAFGLHPQFHVKSLALWAIMGDAMLEDFRGKDCAFVANRLRGKGLNKLCAVFKGIWILIFLILYSGFEYMNVLSCVYNEIQYLYRRFNTTIKSSTEVNYFDPGLTWLWPPHVIVR